MDGQRVRVLLVVDRRLRDVVALLARARTRTRARVRARVRVRVRVGVRVRPSSTVSRHASHTVCSVSVASGRMADAHAACSSADCGSSCTIAQSERAAC